MRSLRNELAALLSGMDSVLDSSRANSCLSKAVLFDTVRWTRGGREESGGEKGGGVETGQKERDRFGRHPALRLLRRIGCMAMALLSLPALKETAGQLLRKRCTGMKSRE